MKWGKCAQDTTDGFWVPLLPHPDRALCPVNRARALVRVSRHLSLRDPLFSLPLASATASHTEGFYTLFSARRWLTRGLAASGLSTLGYTFHSFRRGACTQAFRQGAEITDLQSLGGWRSDAVRLYYPHYEARARAARALVS